MGQNFSGLATPRGSFNDMVHEIVMKIPRGFVMSYGQIAGLLGNRRASRAVGYAMSRCTRKSVPCHRVVYRDGSLAGGYAFGGEGVQRKLLEKEGVAFTGDGRVDMGLHRYRFRVGDLRNTGDRQVT